jgi:hypothetical protein
MIKLHKPSVRAVVASLTALALGATAVTVAQAAPRAGTDPAKQAVVATATAPGADAPQPPGATDSSQREAARSQDGSCEVGELCLYYQWDFVGSGYDGAHNDFNYNNNHFLWAGAGQGQVVGNNARSYWNRDPRAPVYICNYTWAPMVSPPAGGQCIRFEANTFGNLPAVLADHNQSVYWVDSTN